MYGKLGQCQIKQTISFFLMLNSSKCNIMLVVIKNDTALSSLTTLFSQCKPKKCTCQRKMCL